MQAFGVRSKVAYVAPGLVVWSGVYQAGIHPAIAGVVVGLLTPVRAWLGPVGFVQGVRRELATISPEQAPEKELVATLRHVDDARREALAPAESLIETLHPWVAFAIMPIFALANAGVSLSGGPLDDGSWNVATGVAVGLVAGKPIGVLAASWLVVRLGIASLPRGLAMRHLVVLGMVAGVGFTMALFVAQLAFTDPRLLDAAKLGVLGASAGAAVLGLVLGRFILSPPTHANVARTAGEAESSTES
jgi:NhaA family Na+:H+ antiporter